MFLKFNPLVGRSYDQDLGSACKCILYSDEVMLIFRLLSGTDLTSFVMQIAATMLGSEREFFANFGVELDDVSLIVINPDNCMGKAHRRSSFSQVGIGR